MLNRVEKLVLNKTKFRYATGTGRFPKLWFFLCQFYFCLYRIGTYYLKIILNMSKFRENILKFYTAFIEIRKNKIVSFKYGSEVKFIELISHIYNKKIKL